MKLDILQLFFIHLFIFDSRKSILKVEQHFVLEFRNKLQDVIIFN